VYTVDSRRINPVARGTDGRASFANRDFGRVSRVICGNLIFSATVDLRNKPLARAIWRFERRIPRDKDSPLERKRFEPPRPFRELRNLEEARCPHLPREAHCQQSPPAYRPTSVRLSAGFWWVRETLPCPGLRRAVGEPRSRALVIDRNEAKVGEAPDGRCSNNCCGRLPHRRCRAP
jgi:hypothetical protein